MLYRLNNEKLTAIKQENVSQKYLEKDIQKMTEDNLEEVFGLRFIETEFAVDNLRIDTLAFDDESNSFVIIEYKKIKSDSVADQGLAYLSLMLKNKEAFILKFIEKNGGGIPEIDWSQSRVILISPKFTEYQLRASEYTTENFPVELYEFRKYGDIVEYLQKGMKKGRSQKNQVNIMNSSKDEKTVLKEIVNYSEDELVSRGSDFIQEFYWELKDFAENISPEIKFEVKKLYLVFKVNKKNIFSIIIRKNSLYLNLNMQYSDFNSKMYPDIEDVSKKGHWATGDYQMKIDSIDQLETAKEMMKLSYKVNS